MCLVSLYFKRELSTLIRCEEKQENRSYLFHDDFKKKIDFYEKNKVLDQIFLWNHKNLYNGPLLTIWYIIWMVSVNILNFGHQPVVTVTLDHKLTKIEF